MRIKNEHQISSMAELIWNGHCVVCKAPLGIRILCDNYEVYDFIDSWVDLSIFDNNDMRYKFFGRKAKKVCIACMDNYNEMKKYKNIRNIEYGTFPQMSASMSQDKVKAWFYVLEKCWSSYNRCPNILQ